MISAQAHGTSPPEGESIHTAANRTGNLRQGTRAPGAGGEGIPARIVANPWESDAGGPGLQVSIA